MSRRTDALNRLEHDIRDHIERQAQENIERGMAPEEARRQARLAFGNVSLVQEDTRAVWVWRWVDELAQDLRYAVRTLANSPAFAVTAIATLALAIGATTAMFSVVDTVLLRPLPYRSPEQLVALWIGAPGETRNRAAYLTLDDWRRHTSSFSDLAVLDPAVVTVTANEGAERIGVARVSANFLPMLGMQPSLGRLFTGEEAEQRQRVAIVTHRFWQTRLGGSASALGASVLIDGAPSEVIGILPEGADLRGFSADLWEPHTVVADWDERRVARGVGPWFVFGRLRPDVTIDQAQAELDRTARVLDAELPLAERTRGISVVPLDHYFVGARPRLVLWMLTAASGCVLLITMANVLNLSLARSVRRAREMAVRATLGASRARLARQLLVENAVLAAGAGMAGTALAVAGIRLIRLFGPADLPRLNEIALDLRVLAAVAVLCVVIGILLGLAPSCAMSLRHLRLSREDARGVSGSLAARRVRRALVVGEFAMAIVLIAAAGLLVRSWMSIQSVETGFATERVLLMNVSATTLPGDAQRATFYEDVLREVGSLPGVERAGLIGEIFVGGGADLVVTRERNRRSERLEVRVDEASDALFQTLGTPLIRGRFFSAQDSPDAPPVAIINEALARVLWDGGDPVGERFKVGAPDSDNPWVTVVGVVADMRRGGLERDPIPQIFAPLAQRPGGNAVLVIRTESAEPLDMAAAVGSAVRRVNRDMPLSLVTTLADQIASDLEPRRTQTALLSGFSILALLIAAVGIYGLIHHSVATRTQEIGIRMAVGAPPGQIFRIVIGEGLQLTAAGLLLGIAGALWAGRAGSALLFDVSASDPVTLGATSLLLTAVALLACYLPARRAMRVEPVNTLRHV